MTYTNSYLTRELPPKALIYFLLFSGLAVLVYAIIIQNLLIAAAVICFPLAIMLVFYGLQNPRFVYILYTIYAFFFTTISRYTHQTQLSVGLDILLVYLFISLLFENYKRDSNIKLSNAINILTISYIPWILFTLFQFINPGTQSEGITMGIRIWILQTFVLYIVSSTVSNTPKALRIGLNVIGLFTIIAFIKLLLQKYVGFDSAERYWLYVEGGATTHILHTGTRYFSYFTDAANFGTIMGGIAISYAIIGFNTNNRIRCLFYIAIAIMATIGMVMSGTRGALSIPLAGLVLYCLICKSLKTFFTSVAIGVLIFIFFAFTNIGEGNQFIRRTRSAFRPTKDASFNVRVENRKEIAEYLKKHPWGVGIAEEIPKMWQKGDIYVEGTLPSDSFFVFIWIQTGLAGLLLYIAIYVVILLRCCYIVMFRVKDNQLRQTLSGFTCATFGILVSGYVGNSPGMPPTNFLIVAMIAFIMNGSHIDKMITQQKQIENKK